MSHYKEIAKLDVLQRINYLYQAAHLALKQGSGGVSLARFYMQTLSSIAKKSVIRLDPSIKRTMCKRCHGLLVFGVTSTLRIQHKRRRSHQIVTCLQCKSVAKRFPVNPDHRLWSDNSEAWLGAVPVGKNVLEAGLGELPVGQASLEAGFVAMPVEQTSSEARLGTLPVGQISLEAEPGTLSVGQTS